MKYYHVINAKRKGWKSMYDYYTFPADEFTKEEALAQFKPVKRETLKSNGKYYPYTAYLFNGIEYYHVFYGALIDENEYEKGPN